MSSVTLHENRELAAPAQNAPSQAAGGDAQMPTHLTEDTALAAPRGFVIAMLLAAPFWAALLFWLLS